MRRITTLVLLFALLLALRVTAPSDLLEGAQPKQVGYIMDVLIRGNWLLQYEITGEVATKPPFYNWLAAGTCLLFSTESEWAMRFPSLLGGIGLLVCIYVLSLRYFNERVAFYAVLACIASHHFSKLTWFARTDMLMTCLLYLSILAQVQLPPSRWKPWLIGALNGLNALTKGPIGPLLYLLFVILWGRDHQMLRSRQAWKSLGIGAGVCLLMAGVWVCLVWNSPNFKEQVILWQLGSRMGEPTRYRAMLIPVGHLFSRIAPWPLFSLLAIWLAWRGRVSWDQTRFVAWWGVSFLLVFCLIPTKRHDHLLPVYPPFFMLAGVALQDFLGPILMPRARWVIFPAVGLLLAVPLLFPWVDEPRVWVLVAGAFCCGAICLLFYLRRMRSSFIVATMGLIFMQGIYHHEFHQDGRASYEELSTFIHQVKDLVPEGEPVRIYQAHPLIAYQLRQHEELLTVKDLANSEPVWIIAPKSRQQELTRGLNANLVEMTSMTLEPRSSQATLYRVERAPNEVRFAETPEKTGRQ